MRASATTMPLSIEPDDDCCIIIRNGHILLGFRPGINVETLRGQLQQFLGVGHAGTTTNYGAAGQLTTQTPAPGTQRKKRTMSANGRKAIAEATKRRWAEARKEGKLLNGKKLTKAATA